MKTTPPANPKRGRPAYVPSPQDRDAVRDLALAGTPQTRIAKILGVDPKTLRKTLRQELDYGRDIANAAVVANLFRQATKDDPRAISAAIYWTKMRMGWSERQNWDGDAGAIHIDDVRAKIADRIARLAGSRASEENPEPTQ